MRRLKECNTVEFPPVPVCHECGGMETEWVDMDGDGELLAFSFSPMGITNFTKEPVVSGFAKLKEGMYYCAVIENMKPEEQPALLERLKKETVKVELVVTALNEKYNFPYFRLLG